MFKLICKTMDKITDFQIYALATNLNLDKYLKEQALKEFGKRNFSPEYARRLAIEYERVIPVMDPDFTALERTAIIAFPFIVPIHAIIANKYLAHGNIKKWKLYWRYLTIGWVIWSFIIILVLKLFLTN